MKKTMLTIMLMVVALAPTTVSAAQVVVADAASDTAAAATTQEKLVKINGVEMTQEQARLAIIMNIKNHKQMSPEEMVAYISKLEASDPTVTEAAPAPAVKQ